MNKRASVCHPIYSFLPYPQHSAEGRRLSGAMKKLKKDGERPLPITRIPNNDVT